MNTDLDALVTALYVTIDDLLIAHPDWAPERPDVGIAPQLSDAELLTLAVVHPPAPLVHLPAATPRLQQTTPPRRGHDATRHHRPQPSMPVLAR
jgi:hypothetical protein